MLQKTFVHIPGVGPKTELELWRSGIYSWKNLGSSLIGNAPISSALRRRLDAYIPQSIAAVKRRDAGFFSRLSGIGEAWRLFPEFSNQCVFLDIETTGLSSVFDQVTMVGLYDGARYEAFVEGQNLQDLPARLKKYSVVVTFNGSGFDLRFLRLAFKDIQLPPIHIDLRWVTRRLGHHGGLKVIEKDFGIHRDSSVEDLDGHDATVLWSRHLRGDRDALQQLITYNSEDVVHLKAIMEMSYDRLASQTSGAMWSDKKLYEGINAFPKTPKAKRQVIVSGGRTLVDNLLKQSTIRAPRIVGIDLTGSERRATGWALMTGANAETKSISTDEDLIRATLEAKPDLVSIDSPLSVPDGWNRLQEQILPGSPIYRKCELALKRMGISVFWCLLPSMKSLTMRGMRLTDELRKHGLKVIESYPGAAQDILGIPRKGSSLAELKWGLNRAGVEGPYLKTKVTHDEVDAITSALVGLFYLADDYIALGTPSEGHLIVPRSPQINYGRLAEILIRSGLDEVQNSRFSEHGPSEIEFRIHDRCEPIAALVR